MEYLSNILKSFVNTWQTIRQGVIKSTHKPATLRYPQTMPTLPKNARYELFVEISDCIGCDLCVKICPADCIDLKVHKAEEVIGFTSQGLKKRLYIDKFDIDMAKCMFCGLCPTVCPTDCIFMTNKFDNTTAHVQNFNYNFLSNHD